MAESELFASSQQSLAGATLYAMTRYAERPCPETALQVARHLECTADQHDGDAALAALCATLAARWRSAVLDRLQRRADEAV